MASAKVFLWLWIESISTRRSWLLLDYGSFTICVCVLYFLLQPLLWFPEGPEAGGQ